MAEAVSIAIETSCRAGGVALGVGDELAEAVSFEAHGRHAAQLLCRLDELLAGRGLKPADVDEVYVSAGPGSFTGIRVGVTAARTLAQAVAGVRCVGVPTARAVAENLRGRAWERLAVVFDAKNDNVYVQEFARRDGRPEPDGPPRVVPKQEFLATVRRPVLLTGEGLAYHELAGEGVELAEPDVRLPTAEGVWRVGRRLAAAGEYTEYHHLLPIYTRRPEAVRLWENRHRWE